MIKEPTRTVEATCPKRQWPARSMVLPRFAPPNDIQFELRRLLYRQAARLLTLQYAIDVRRRAPVLIATVNTVGDQATADGVIPRWKDGGNMLSLGESNEVGHDHIDRKPHQLCSKFRKGIQVPPSKAEVENDRLALDVTQVAQPFT